MIHANKSIWTYQNDKEIININVTFNVQNFKESPNWSINMGI